MNNRFKLSLPLHYAYSDGARVISAHPSRPTCRSGLKPSFVALPGPMTQQWEARPDHSGNPIRAVGEGGFRSPWVPAYLFSSRLSPAQSEW